MHSGSPDDLETAGDDPMFTGIMDSGIVTLQPEPGTMGADASTPVQGTAWSVHPQNCARPKPFGLNLPTPVPGKPPPQQRLQPRTDLSNLQPADGHRIAVIERDIHTEIGIASSSDADPVDLAGSTQTGLVDDYESP